MKKIKLNTSVLRLKKEEISNLTENEMTHLIGGVAISDQCPTNTCGSTPYTCMEFSQGPNCPSKGCPTPTDPPFGWSWLIQCHIVPLP